MNRIIKKCCNIFIFTLLISSCSTNDNAVLTQVKKRTDYPSASAVEYLNEQIFVMGDDAKDLLVLDSNFNTIDSISFYSYPEKRIPKNIKPDIEAMAFYQDSPDSVIFLFGSGALPPYRNSGWRYYPQTKMKDSISLESLYTEIKHKGIDEINIEGACFIPGFLVLANRGNKNYPKNHLIFTEKNFWNKKNDYNSSIALIVQQDDSLTFSGISGLDYLPQNDWLILTVSTEDTHSNFEDGAIGKSYLWIIKDITSKRNQKIISPDKIIDLETVSPQFKGQKIESAKVLSVSNDKISLAIAADNDDGSSSIFKIYLEKN